DRAYDTAKQMLRADPQLAQFIDDRRTEIATVVNDHQRLLQVVSQHHWDVQAPYDIAKMKRPLYETTGLSEQAKKALGSFYFEKIVQSRSREGKPFTLDYIIKRATSLDWSVLDLFYRLCGFQHFKQMLDLAEAGTDEGPTCNLGLISQHLARFMDEYRSVLTADVFLDDGFLRMFFSTFLYTLFRRGETEYEDAEDPFPKGRIPFLTVHQAKGLEFPIVVLGNARKDDRGPQPIEEIVRPFINRDSEPLDRMTEFDIMRMFYVALSRAKNLLVIAHFSGRGNRVNQPFKAMLDANFPRIPDFDMGNMPAAKVEQDDLPKNYSYTGDYLLYQRCPRQYMIFRKYGFVPSRSQTMMFGSLVHRTLDDLHQYLISRRSQP
ncbi:MAG TPA: 3'-5' exonuclease, partial [Anaerolineae bacterium]